MPPDTNLAPICFQCKHFLTIKPEIGYTCSAFGENSSIPIEIMVSSADHRKPYKGDGGTIFSPRINDLALAYDPPESEAQRRAMFAAARGHSTLGIPKKVGEEFSESDPGGKLPKRAKDMSGGDWKGLIRGLLRFFWEESQEEAHQEHDGARDAESSSGKLSEHKRAEIGRPGSSQREDMEESDFLKPSDRTYPVKDPKTGKYDRDLLLAAARRARLNGEESLAKKADEIREREFGHDATCDPDRHIYDGLIARDEWPFEIAADKEPIRKTDDSGHMHVTDTVLSKAVVSPYLGSEINAVMKDFPGWKMLDPGKTYHLLRDPEELKKSVGSFNGKPLLWRHRGVSAADHPADIVIGSTGTNARFQDPDLINDLVVWPKYATEAIEGGEKKSLSCGYAYKADMTPGTHKGHPYDGIMRDIIGNHVALVDKPRVPGAKVGGDSLPDSDIIWLDLAAAILKAAA